MTSLATVLLLAARAHAGNSAPAPASINLAVSGAVDAGIVATSIASELARPVTPIAPTDACHAPCLAIAVTSSAATVTFTTADGGTRQRTIELGSDRTQWTTMLTLLAGNLVRDEAADLLPDPPAPEPAVETPPSAAPVIEPAIAARAQVAVVVVPERISPIGFGLVPGISTDLLDFQRSHSVSIGLVASTSGNVHGLAISGAVDVALRVSGLQLSGAVAVAGDLTGVQLAGAVTVADHSIGTQIAGAASIADVANTQFAGAVSFAGRSQLQIAGAVTASDIANTQFAGAVSVAHRSQLQIAGAVTASDVAAMQVAGAVSVAHEAATQISGAVNVTGHLSGFQLAPINVARRNDGVQLGVINIGGGPDGDSFGLINIVPGGRTDLEASVDSDGIGTVMLRHGGRHWHNVYGFGGQHVNEQTGAPNDDVWMYGLGIGPSFHVAGLPADLDVIAWEVSHGDHHEEHLSLLNQLRLTIGVPVGPVTLVAGGALNAYVSSDHTSPFITARTITPDPMDTNVTVKVWPSVFVGARL